MCVPQADSDVGAPLFCGALYGGDGSRGLRPRSIENNPRLTAICPRLLCHCCRYAYELYARHKTGRPLTLYSHIWVWLASLRTVDMQSDIGFYFISLRGSFGEASGPFCLAPLL